MRTIAPTRGLQIVGGHSKGDAFICFDKPSYRSYNLKQSANAAVSEDAMTAVNAALNNLIEKAPVIAGMKLLHWYKETIPQEADIIPPLLGQIVTSEDEDEKPSQYEILSAKRVADRLILSVKEGEMPQLLQNRYYILCLSGANGRVMVRGYWEGSYEELYENYSAWFNDLSLTLPYSRGLCKPLKLFALQMRLMTVVKKRESISEISERMAKELAGLEPHLLYAILHNTPLPDAIASRALRYIRSTMLASQDEESNREPLPDPLACQLLKAWLIRKQKEKGEPITVKENCNSSSTNSAYQAGRMMAVFAAIQRAAMPEVGTGVIQRYYTSASTSPALVLGKLSSLSQYHLGKLETGLSIYYSRMLDEIASKMNGLPVTLTLEEQSNFALGYYQQRAAMYARTPDNAEENKEEE